MSRLRHRSSGHKKTHQKTMHHAAGGEAEVGNPLLFKLAKGHSMVKSMEKRKKKPYWRSKGWKDSCKTPCKRWWCRSTSVFFCSCKRWKMP